MGSILVVSCSTYVKVGEKMTQPTWLVVLGQ
jgi:hypothetical protein